MKMRQRITDLLLRDFGYSFEKFNKKLEKRYGGKPYEELTDTQKHDYERQKKRNESFDEWFIAHERETIMDCLHAINEHVYVANSIYPTCQEELTGRRIHQDIAIGQSFRMVQELEYACQVRYMSKKQRENIDGLYQKLYLAKYKKIATEEWIHGA